MAISILGSTGSIGRQTLDILQSEHLAPGAPVLEVAALAAGASNLELLGKQIVDFEPELVAVPSDSDRESLRDILSDYFRSGKKTEILIGEEGLIACATHPSAKTVVTAVVGFLGVKPTLEAIKAGKTIALANKETMVAAGHLVNELAAKHGSKIVPVDSEHSAIYQSLEASILKAQAAGKSLEQAGEVEKLLLTGSGGPFRTWSEEAMARATVSDALKHPNWSMGAKITIDSATLMNKGLEVIEARWLFSIPAHKIEVVIHPQSILHSAVEFVDGSIVGQLGLPDMRLPIHFALYHPHRVPSARVPRLSLSELKDLTFEKPNFSRFPCLAMAQEVAANDDSSACVLNAANEIAVDSFLKGKITFTDIARTIERTLSVHKPIKAPQLGDILEADRWAREKSVSLVAV
ncbi:MAG: 1-deoxy-D-xylulose-5-phosphate reductoisomerase [Candidatus Obscuribacter phosphatis]|uniref:1-deoxy-D-xylulose 5-phosphate reductoisomerase n=1 Tax=Candidatus Obscuribacter phosphatis TaxID=1906157 RepID=A0A8J7TN02_9BACT|nr:1-deoxy-D-xylulose-5-phosphate reductoisomerase [Candidatus Obscuribacter phosphatis]